MQSCEQKISRPDANVIAPVDYRGWPPLLMDRDYVFPDDGFPLGVRIIDNQSPYCHHIHDHYNELVVVGAGSAIHEVDTLRYPLRAGDVFLILGDRVHSYDRIDGLKLYNVLFDPRELRLPWRELENSAAYQVLFRIDPVSDAGDRFEHRFRLAPPLLDRAIALIERLDALLTSRTDCHRFAGVGAFATFLSFLLEAYDQAPVDNVPHRLGMLAGYMEKHCTERITIADMCRIAGMSQPTLFRLFRHYFKDSPNHYLLCQRLARAAALLVAQPDFSIAQIGVQCGFADGAYFSRQFQHRMGCSPCAYRRRYQSGS